MISEPTTNNFPQPPETNYVLHRRFDRMGRLVGDAAMKKLRESHVIVIGLGGVGSWAAESLMRSGLGKITLVDFDEVCITNANRQLHALQGLVGKKKASVMSERMKKINPQAEVIEKAIFYNEENSEQILGDKADFIIDAIDNLTATPAVRNLIRENKTYQIPSIIQTSARQGMISYETSLKALVDKGIITPATMKSFLPTVASTNQP